MKCVCACVWELGLLVCESAGSVVMAIHNCFLA